MSIGPSRLYDFHSFRVDEVHRLLLRDGIPIPLTPKAFDTLLTLIRNRGRILTKDELLTTIWPDTFVEEATLAQNIFTLRRALGGSEGDHYIQTIPKRGYRFVANVTEVKDGRAGFPANNNQHYETGTHDRAAYSLAVLPLIGASDDPNADYLSDGITESVVNTLSLLPYVQIKACSTVVHFKEREPDPQEAGRELAVDSVLIGRVIKFGPNLLIRMELIDVMNGWQLWGEEYSQQLSNIHDFRREIAKDISERLSLKLTAPNGDRLLKPGVQEAEAYQFYLQGRYFLNMRTKEGSRKAIECFEQAIEMDPTCALAYSGLADSHINFDFYGLTSTWEIIQEARAAAVKAFELDNQLAEAHTSLGLVKLVYDHDLWGAERQFKQAIRLNPKYTRAHDAYAHCLRQMGRAENCLAEIKLGLECDPFDLEINQHLGWHYLIERQYDLAIEQLQKTLSMAPNLYRARILLGITYGRKKLFSQAIEEFLRAERLEKTTVLSAFLGYSYAMDKKVEASLKILDDLLEESKYRYVPPYCIAIVYAALGKQEAALDWLQKAFVEHRHWGGWLAVTAELDSLRAHPRLIEIVEDRFTRGRS